MLNKREEVWIKGSRTQVGKGRGLEQRGGLLSTGPYMSIHIKKMLKKFKF